MGALLDLALILRQLLVDGSTLADTVNRPHRLRLRFKVGESTQQSLEAMRVRGTPIPDRLWHGDRLPGQPTHTLTRDQFLRHGIAYVDGEHYSVLQIIKACANRLGGVHCGNPTDDDQDEAAIRCLNSSTVVAGAPSMFRTLYFMAEVTCDALAELHQVVKRGVDLSVKYPGISLRALVRLSDMVDEPCRYLFQLGDLNGERFSVCLDGASRLTVSVEHLVLDETQAMMSFDCEVPLNRWFLLGADLGLASYGSIMRAFVDGQIVRSETYSLRPLRLHASTSMSIAADLDGRRTTNLDVSEILNYGVTLDNAENADAHAHLLRHGEPRRFLEFRAGQWMRTTPNGHFMQADSSKRPIWRDLDAPKNADSQPD